MLEGTISFVIMIHNLIESTTAKKFEKSNFFRFTAGVGPQGIYKNPQIQKSLKRIG